MGDIGRLCVLLFYGICINWVEGEYFLGSTLTYNVTIGSGSITTVFITQTYLFNYSEVYCENSMVVFKNCSNELNCTRHCNRLDEVKSLSNRSICVSHSESVGITIGERSNIISMTDVSSFRIALSSGAWRRLSLPMELMGNVFWNVICSITLRIRSNGKYNSPPLTRLISPIRIPVNISSIIQIPATDPDNDQIRCRLASGADDCGDVCYSRSLPNGTHLLSNCTLVITGENVDDWYGVTILVEDFLNSTSVNPLSSIPIQFLINVQNVTICRPPYLTGFIIQAGQCIDQPYKIQFTVENFCPNTTDIKDITILSFPNVTKIPFVPNSTLESMLLLWTPDQIGPRNICAVAVDSENRLSNEHCVSVNVTDESVLPCPETIATTQLTTIDSTTMLTTSDSTSRIIVTSDYTNQSGIDTTTMSTTTQVTTSSSIEPSIISTTSVFSSSHSITTSYETHSTATEHNTSITVNQDVSTSLPHNTSSNVISNNASTTSFSSESPTTDAGMTTNLSDISTATISQNQPFTVTSPQQSSTALFPNLLSTTTKHEELSSGTSLSTVSNNILSTTTKQEELWSGTSSTVSNNTLSTTTKHGELSSGTSSTVSDNTSSTTTKQGELLNDTSSLATVLNNITSPASDDEGLLADISSSVAESYDELSTTIENDEFWTDIASSTKPSLHTNNFSEILSTPPPDTNDTTTEVEQSISSGSSSPRRWLIPLLAVLGVLLIVLIFSCCCCRSFCCSCCKRSPKHLPIEMNQRDNTIQPPRKPYRVEKVSENERNINANNIRRGHRSSVAPIPMSPPPNNIPLDTPTALSASYLFGNNPGSR